jgi:chromate reductase
MHTVAILVGSFSKNSLNKKLARNLMDIGSALLAFSVVPLEDVPLLNQDLEEDLPAAVRALQEGVAGADGVLLITPEHNRFMSAIIKNAVDWCSRPYGKGKWVGKPVATAGVSPGAIGTAVGQAHLRALLSSLGARMLPQPEVYLAARPGFFDASGVIADEGSRTFLRSFLTRFADWIARA